MSLYSDCILWNKLGEAGEITTSAKGNNGTVTGNINYAAAKFDNGAVANATNDGIAEFGNLGVQDKFIVEHWLKPTSASGDPVASEFIWGFYFDNNNRCGLLIDYANSKFIVQIVSGGGSFFPEYVTAWNANDLIHVMLVFDKDAGFDGAKTVALYINGVQVLSSANAFNFSNDFTKCGVLGTYFNNAVFASQHLANSICDNVKVYNDATATLITQIDANKENESFAPEQITNVVATDGAFTTHVNVSWTLDALATSYNVYRSDNDVDFTLIQSVTTNSYNDADNVAGQIYYYKVSGVNGSGEGDLSASDDGYRAIRQATLDCVIERPKVLILDDDTDIYALGYVDKLIRIEENKTFRRDKLIINSIAMKVKNYNNFFSLDSNESIFKNALWRYSQFKIIAEDGQVLWDGIVKDITRDHNKSKMAIVRSDDLLSKYIKRKISYTSSDWEPPAEAFKNILDQEGFTQYNAKSVQDSINQQDDNNCYIKCFINQDDDVTLHQIMEKLGEIGCADVYNSFNEVYYSHWQPFTGGVKVDLTADDLRTAPKVSSPDTELINDYRIGYDGDADVPLTDSGQDSPIGNVSRTRYGTQDLREFDCSAGNQIVFKDAASAQYIGECYIRRSHVDLGTNPRSLQMINFDLYYTHREWTTLQTFFRLTLTDEDWDEKLFEIFKIVYDYDANNVNITAMEVDENAG